MYGLLSVVLLLLAATACQKDLVRWPNHLMTHYNVNFDWTDCPSADPSLMMFVAFPTDGNQKVEYGIKKKTGGEVNLAAGEYKAIAYNDDAGNILANGDLWDDFYLYTPLTTLDLYSSMFATRSIPRAEGSEEEDIVEEPDMVWTSSKADVPRAGDNESESVTLLMQPAVYVFHFTITNVANLDHVIDLAATISGMSRTMKPSTGLPTENHCTIPVSVSRKDEKTLFCEVRSFGHCPNHDYSLSTEQEGDANHHLMVYARLADGSKWYYDFDVKKEIHNSENIVIEEEGNVEVNIKLDDLPFPRSISEDSGLHPNVENWDEENIDIPM